MAQDFYPFVENGDEQTGEFAQVRHPARIAVYDDDAAAPRVVVVEPKDVRAYLEEITLQVTQLAQQQGSTIPFMVIREIVENLIHAYFMEPTVSILDHGNTIRFSDQGPGIAEKERALQYGTTSATEEMRRYIRGVGSGLPYVKQYMHDKGGSLKIEDNMSGGTVVTLSTQPAEQTPPSTLGFSPQSAPMQPWQQPAAPQSQPAGWQSWQQQAPQQWQQPWPSAAPQQQWPAQQPQSPQQWPPQPPQQWPAQQPMPSPTPQQPPTPSWPQITVRGRAVLDYLCEHDAVGPSDLSREYGESQPTWTRELQTLEEAGLVRKDGQKRRLTAMGQAFVAQA